MTITEDPKPDDVQRLKIAMRRVMAAISSVAIVSRSGIRLDRSARRLVVRSQQFLASNCFVIDDHRQLSASSDCYRNYRLELIRRCDSERELFFTTLHT